MYLALLLAYAMENLARSESLNSELLEATEPSPRVDLQTTILDLKHR